MSYTTVGSFNLTSGNDFWSLIQEANQMHITARQKYLQAFQLLESRRVAFSDIRGRLLNEAKLAGMYRRDYKPTQAPKGSKFIYAPKSELKRRNESWYVALNNFMRWINTNYIGYGVAAKKRTPKPKVEATASITRKTDSEGNVVETRTDTESVTGTPDGVASVISPVLNDLSLQETQQLILANMPALGAYAEDKGALTEYNALCVALGLDTDIFEEEDTEEVAEEVLIATDTPPVKEQGFLSGAVQ